MQNLDLQKIKNVHFIGIGGIGVSAVARMMVHNGKNVTGQDMQEGEVVEELRKIGVVIEIGKTSYDKIPNDTDLVVYTVAIETYEKELFDKLKLEEKFPIRSYPEMLGIISSDKYTIAVCGTHGKTTTTGMMAQILKDNESDPTVIVGSLLKDKDGNRTNFIGGRSEYFVVEACEYRRSFLNINPKILVITNIDNDHLDYYKDIEDIKNAFREMAIKVPSDGFIICNPDDPHIADVVKGLNAKIINWQDYYKSDLKLKIPGNHNKKDAAAAIAAAHILGIPKNKAEELVGNFPGTWKRFELKGKLPSGVLIYDDYAHHPTEIIATLEGFRELYPQKEGWKLTIVFQPHLFSRTKLLLADFAKSFTEADQVLILPIYFAREEDDGIINSIILSDEINKHSDNSQAFSDFESLGVYLQTKLSNMNEKCVIITMGAGGASKIGESILNNY